MRCQEEYSFRKPGVIKVQCIGSEELTLMLTHDVSGQFDLYQ